MNALTIDKLFPGSLKLDLEDLYLRYNENDIILYFLCKNRGLRCKTI